jgi:hypothetical protein
MVPGFGRDAARGLACGIVAVLASSPFSTALANDLRIETGAVERTTGSAGLRVSAKVDGRTLGATRATTTPSGYS